MPLEIKNPDLEALADEVADLAGVSSTEAITKALEELRNRLRTESPTRSPRGSAGPSARVRAFTEYLQSDVWSKIPPDLLGKPLSKAEEEDLLGLGVGDDDPR